MTKRKASGPVKHTNKRAKLGLPWHEREAVAVSWCGSRWTQTKKKKTLGPHTRERERGSAFFGLEKKSSKVGSGPVGCVCTHTAPLRWTNPCHTHTFALLFQSWYRRVDSQQTSGRFRCRQMKRMARSPTVSRSSQLATLLFRRLLVGSHAS